jgi:hypothetical protein
MSAFTLYFVHSPIAKLGVIFASTVLFSLVLAIISRTKRVEIFTATAASVLP